MVGAWDVHARMLSSHENKINNDITLLAFPIAICCEFSSVKFLKLLIHASYIKYMAA